QALYRVRRRRCAGDLDRVDVRLDQERRLLEIRSSLGVGDRRKPDVTALVGLADRLGPEELGPFLGPALEDVRQLVVPVEPVESDVRHLTRGAAASWRGGRTRCAP